MLNYDLFLSRDSFLLGFELRLFWIVSLIYALSLALHLIYITTGSSRFGRTAHGTLWAGVIVHSALITLRTFEAGHAPFQTLYESLSFFAFSATITYLFVARKWRNVYLPGTFVAALSLGACLYALLSRSPAADPLSPPLQSYWFEWHVILAFLSYAVFVVSASIEASYLIIKAVFSRGVKKIYGFTPEMLDGFHKQSFRLVLFGFPLLTFAIFSGAAWANEAWGRYWSWDPKETWSLITWTVFSIYLHSMTIPRFKNLPASVFNIIGFICMMMTFLGVNWLAKLLGIPSLHIYAV